jgi:hypothetical protein
VTAPPAYTASPAEHRDSLPEDVEIDVTHLPTVRTYQRVAAEMLKRQHRHAAEIRKFARRLAADYLAECTRQARAASLEEFGSWLNRRGDVIQMRSKPRVTRPDWRTTS